MQHRMSFFIILLLLFRMRDFVSSVCASEPGVASSTVFGLTVSLRSALRANTGEKSLIVLHGAIPFLGYISSSLREKIYMLDPTTMLTVGRVDVLAARWLVLSPTSAALAVANAVFTRESSPAWSRK